MLGLLAGAFTALQAPMNAKLSRGLGSPVAAAAVSFVSGAVVLAVISALLVQAQGLSIAWRAPPHPWMSVAGGAAATMAFLVTGQMLARWIIDRFGLLGVPVREISLGRIAEAALPITGAVLIRVR